MTFRPQYQFLAFSSKSRNATCVSFSGGGSHIVFGLLLCYFKFQCLAYCCAVSCIVFGLLVCYSEIMDCLAYCYAIFFVFLCRYLMRLVDEFMSQMVLYRKQIDDLEGHLSRVGSSNSFSSQGQL